jgi:hypothetical protein
MLMYSLTTPSTVGGLTSGVGLYRSQVYDGELVVDSRLIAERLGIEHRSFFGKY